MKKKDKKIRVKIVSHCLGGTTLQNSKLLNEPNEAVKYQPSDP